jgi:hypothetical protein
MTAKPWAAEFCEIFPTLAKRPDLRAAMGALLVEHEIPVKVTEGGDRRARRKAILGPLFDGAITLDQAIARTEVELARDDSPHRENNLVFASGWAKRLVHTHTSVFYTWAVLDALLAAGQSRCFVARSSAESGTSACARLLAGQPHDARVLRDRLIQSYVAKKVMRVPLVPNHPHCTHVASPLPGAG